MNIIKFREKVSHSTIMENAVDLGVMDWFEEAFSGSVISVYMRIVGNEIVKCLSISLKYQYDYLIVYESA